MKTGDKIKAENANWQFNGDVVNAFDDHISKSVPSYFEGHNTICQLSDFFIKQNSNIYEIGCSTGTLSLKLAERHQSKSNVQFFGIDVEQDMVDYANKKLAKTKLNNVLFSCEDIILSDIEKSDFIVCYYTIQFIHPAVRQQVMDKLYQSLNWGGALIMFEKTRAPDARFQDIVSTMYLEYKLQKGYSSEEITGKIMSLKGVLEPFSTQGNIDILTRSGFIDIMIIQKILSFEGFLAIK